MAFSRDSSRLAVGLGAQGIRILRVTDGTVLAQDKDYAGGVYGLDFTRDGRLAASSLDGDVRLYDERGNRERRLPTQAGRRPTRLQFSQDGTLLALAVAASGDGTIRWYRLRDGRELLAAFLTRDAGRWIAFSPSGYYAAAPAAEDLIGWPVNRGADQAADFFPASRFRDRFYRPDVVRLRIPGQVGQAFRAHVGR